MAAPANRCRNGVTVLLLCAVVAGMAGLSFASAPLYRLFCQATGYGGTTQRATAAPKEIADTLITVRFDAETVTGTATFNVTPTKTGIYFDKLQCFCFNEQQLKPGESRDMGVVFFVDPDLLTDPSTSDVRTITLSYTMFRAPESGAPGASSSASPSPPSGWGGPAPATQAVTQAVN